MDQIIAGKPKIEEIFSANINGLHYINENSGISGGDTHIKSSATSLKAHFGFEIFCMSGDEFIGITPQISQVDFETNTIRPVR